MIKSACKKEKRDTKEGYYMLSQNTINTRLHPALFPFDSSSRLQLQPGKYICTIQATQGDLVFHHFAYDIYNGTWTKHPEDGEPDSVVIHEGETRNLELTCAAGDGYADDISIVNHSLIRPAEFSCTCVRQ